MAGSLGVLNAARAVQGVAAATVNVTSLALVSAAFPRSQAEGLGDLGAAIVVLGLVLAAGYRGFPRGTGGVTEARREAGALESEEAHREAAEGGRGGWKAYTSPKKLRPLTGPR